MAANRIYGMHVANYRWSEGDTAILNRTVEVYKTAKQVKLLLWDSGRKGWRDSIHQPIGVTYTTEEGLNKALVEIGVPVGVEAEKPAHDHGTMK